MGRHYICDSSQKVETVGVGIVFPINRRLSHQIRLQQKNMGLLQKHGTSVD